MEYLERDVQDYTIQYMQISKSDRANYEAANEKLSASFFLQEIATASCQFVEMAKYVLQCVDAQSNQGAWHEIRLDTHIAELFYSYAVDGKPEFLYTYENRIKREINESDGGVDFGTYLSPFMAYNELFTCLDESMGGTNPSYAMKVVLNMFFARLKLDAALYSDEEFFLGIPEVALLARMKEKSVRNFAHRSLGAEHYPDKRMTLIPAKVAHEWLKGRRKFTPSALLETEHAQRTLVSIANEFGSHN